MNSCVVEGCGKEIPPIKIMCVPHWSAVPRDIKLHIWVLYETGYGPGTTPWQAAIQAAARAVHKATAVPVGG